MKKYKILVFDVDDTLIREKASVMNGIRAISCAQSAKFTWTEYVKIESAFWDEYRQNGLNSPEIFIKNEFDEHGRRRRDYVRAERFKLFFPGIDQKRAYELLDIFEFSMKEVARPMPRAKTVVKKLAEKYTLIAATDGVHEIAEEKLNKTGLNEHLAELFSPLTAGCVKPKPEYFTPILAKFGQNPQDYLIVGNSLKADIALAKNLGADSVLVNTWKETNFGEFEPTFVVEDLAELLEFL